MIKNSKMEVTITDVPCSYMLIFKTEDGRYVLSHYDPGELPEIKSVGKIIHLRQTNGTRPHIDIKFTEQYILDNIKNKPFSELKSRDEVVLKSILMKLGEMSGLSSQT